jgi:hypothetical protein
LRKVGFFQLLGKSRPALAERAVAGTTLIVHGVARIVTAC